MEELSSSDSGVAAPAALLPLQTRAHRSSLLPPLALHAAYLAAPLPLGPADLSHGTLANGVRFYARQNSKPSGRCALALVVNVGSLAEEEGERGVAHILEHLAFSATQLFSRHELVAFLESAGLAFGACQNAYTSADETVYELLVPLDAPGLLAQALHVLAQFAFGIRASDEDVERERGAVLEEWRANRTARGRAGEAHYRLLHEGSRYAERLPIGSELAIRSVSGATVRGFRDAWYRPERMAVIAVGDFEDGCAPIVDAIRAAFDGCTPQGASQIPPSLPVAPFVPHIAPRVLAYSDRELAGTSAQLSFSMPQTDLKTPGDLRSALLIDIFANALATRLFRMSRLAEPPFFTTSVTCDDASRATQVFCIGATAPLGGALVALEAVALELARVRLHGLSARELAVTRALMRSDVETSYVERDQAQSENLRAEYTRHFLADECVIDAELETRLTLALLDDISDAEVTLVASRLRSCDSCVVKVAASARHPSEREILSVLSAIERQEAEGTIPPAAISEVPDALLSTLPEPASMESIVQRTVWPQLGLTELRLRNGMRVAIQPTPLLDDQVLVRGIAVGGLTQLDIGSAHGATGLCATALASEAGPFGFSPADLADILAGKRATLSASIAAFTRTVDGEVSPDDLEEGLQLFHLLLTTRPAATAEILQSWFGMTLDTMREQRNDAAFLFSCAVKAAQYGRRCSFLQPMSQRTLALVKPNLALDVFAAAFASPSEFTLLLTGAVTEEAALPYILRYLATIPPSPPSPLGCARELVRPVPDLTFPCRPHRQTVRAVMAEESASASVAMTFPIRAGAPPPGVETDLRADFARLAADSLRIHLICQLLQTRLLKVMRFETGRVYSISVTSSFGMEAPSRAMPFRGEASVQFSCAPDEAWRLVDATCAALALLKTCGASAEECATVLALEERARELDLESNDFQARRALSCLTSHRFGGDSDACLAAQEKARAEVLASLTPETLRDACSLISLEPHTAVVLLPRAPTLRNRALAALSAVAASIADTYSTQNIVLAAAATVGAAGLIYLRISRCR